MPPDSTDDLQFSTPEPIASSPIPVRKCVGCGTPITSTYYAFRDKTVCPQCVQKVNAPPVGLAIVRLAKAAVFGIAGGILGATIWFVVRRVAHAEIGLIAIVVGFLVGKAVRKGSAGRGGREYQVLAVVITYCCICANYIPDVIEAMNKPVDQLTSRQIINLLGFILRIPFPDGASNAIGLLIIGFALWEAWKFNRPRKLAITGPYQMNATPPSYNTNGVVV